MRYFIFILAVLMMGMGFGQQGVAGTVLYSNAFHQCDVLAADPDDPNKITKGVDSKTLDSAAAIKACKEAIGIFPNEARFQYQLGRALNKGKNYNEAVKWYRKAAEQANTEYSILLEEDKDQVMFIYNLPGGKKMGIIIDFDGFYAFKKTFEEDAEHQFYIQPIGLRRKGEMSSYMQGKKYEIANIDYTFATRDKSQFLIFTSKEAVTTINSYIANDAAFTFAGLGITAWYAGTFYPIKEVQDLLDFSLASPFNFCHLLSEQVVNKLYNIDLRVDNLKDLMSSKGVGCDENLNLVDLSDKNSKHVEEEKEKENKWVVSEITKSTVYATVNGNVTHGDKLRIRFVKGKCDMGNLLTTVYTASNHPNILQLEDKYITANFMGTKVIALVLYTLPFLGGHISWVDLNFIPKEDLKRILLKENPIKMQFVDSDEIAITEYFDITQNSWSNQNLGEAVDKASRICEEL